MGDNAAVLLSRLVAGSAEVAATRSRLAKRSIIAALVREAGPADLVPVVTWLSGRLTQRRTGLGWGGLRDAPPPAAVPSLTVGEVEAGFAALAAAAGTGSQALRRAVVADLWGRATADEQTYLNGLALEDVRQGAQDSTVQDAIAVAFEVPSDVFRRAAMLLGSTAAAASLLARQGPAAVSAVGLVVGVPISPMLAGTAPDVAAALAKAAPDGGVVLVDRKLDGIRVQVHRDGDRVRIFTRSLDDITDRLPETVESVLALPASRLVLDGEAIVLRPDGRPAPFQVTGARTASSADVASLRSGAPVSTFFFDALAIEDRDLLDEPLRDRLKALHALLPPALRVPAVRTAALEEADAFLSDSVAAGHEGVLVKHLGSAYEAGRRGSGWVKVKPRHSLDLVVLAAEWGSGRRVGWLSNLHLGARSDADDDTYVMLGKTFKGLTDELLTWQTEQLLAREVRRTPNTVYVRPELVAEIAIDGVQSSRRYPGGVALRFARVLRYRDDKDLSQADTLATVRALLPT
ncbi:MAG: DNA_ligase_IV_Ku-like [uncultured Nocardioidaceae bacterium]|uniref:DNA ligase n=1 Tax=uncultured Nocardioidaceae bacterium TaxID=253824 RepID=A0A6J4MCP3_9ACTN|nr:MAG: DNA_ligase_IV_Ku-like [uncultured Nocardioidaceae bacterium]